MNNLPIIQTFFDTPVRFFKTEFTPELYCHNNSIDSRKTLLETWAIPLPDYCEAIGYGSEHILRIISRNRDVFDGFYRIEAIPDRNTGQKRRTIFTAIEMCDGLNMKLRTARLKDPNIKEMITRFQRWVLFAFHLIRTGRLKPVRWNFNRDIPIDYQRILCLPSSFEAGKMVREMAQKEDKTIQCIYKRLRGIRGSNAITNRGVPRKSPSQKGNFKCTQEYKTALFIHCQLPKLEKKEIARIVGIPAQRACKWLRAA